MRRICAWCGDTMGEKPGACEETHGICVPCLGKHFPGMEAAAAGLFQNREEPRLESTELRTALA